MRKISVTLFVVVVVLVFSYCSSSKKAAVTVAKVTYQANIMQLVQANCAPCSSRLRLSETSTYSVCVNLGDHFFFREAAS